MFKKGCVSWNKGLKVDKSVYPKMGHLEPHSDKSKDKMSLSREKFFKRGGTVWNKGKENPEMIGNTRGFKKGQTPWNKGKKNPLLSERNRTNNPQKKGKLSSTWKGGCAEYRKREALTRDDYTCQICGMREIEIMVVDHIKPKSIFPELRLEINNLMTLCPNCHARKTIREKKQKYDRDNYQKVVFNPENSYIIHI